MKTIQINKLYFYVSTLVDEPVLKVKVTAQNDTHANLYRINILDDRHCTVESRTVRADQLYETLEEAQAITKETLI